jgi:coenzyme F420-reducing hydrogenase gamma subunit
MSPNAKPRVGIFGLSGCFGEQIVMLNCEDELLSLVGAVELADFLTASSVNDTTGPLDIAFVEGSVGTAREETALRRIRQRAGLLVACGSCACFGGVQACWNGAAREAAAYDIYGPVAGELDRRAHRPLRDFVRVDASIPGCPIEKHEFLQAVACLLNGDMPEPVTWPVCAECRMKEQECLLIAYGIHCSGPITAGGCGARCPGFNAPCIGCRGPADDANVPAMEAIVTKAGYTLEAFRRRQRLFAGAPHADVEEIRK